MAGCDSIAPYCQECGRCDAMSKSASEARLDESFVDLIVDEVIRVIQVQSDKTCKTLDKPLIPLGVSNRHVHITKATLVMLFGSGTKLEKYRELYQPGEIAAQQTVTIVGSKMRAIQNVRILGPLRNYDQVELSLTDAVQIGINPPVRNSGDLKGAAPLTLVGPKGAVYLDECAIIANRHVHMNSKMAQIFGIKNGDLCKVRIGGIKSTVFENILVRVNDIWKLHLHLDTDDANAANVRCEIKAEFIEKM